jgi:hypothetical protein
MFYDYSVMVIGRKRQTCQNRQPRTALTVLSLCRRRFFAVLRFGGGWQDVVPPFGQLNAAHDDQNLKARVGMQPVALNFDIASLLPEA